MSCPMVAGRQALYCHLGAFPWCSPHCAAPWLSSLSLHWKTLYQSHFAKAISQFPVLILLNFWAAFHLGDSSLIPEALVSACVMSCSSGFLLTSLAIPRSPFLLLTLWMVQRPGLCFWSSLFSTLAEWPIHPYVYDLQVSISSLNFSPKLLLWLTNCPLNKLTWMSQNEREIWIIFYSRSAPQLSFLVFCKSHHRSPNSWAKT